ncbi:hypothetical protein LWI29_034606 [Acer saccharum]|uniref:FLZ-type domain-containing protein n=1 Tax=Acer saccharum TaxID=4024 RepID=A0AA39SYV2_ACESA|nr:hypothetical protein LWI29_020767 [Acer saccharum]KAK0608097.1 hypothetical protein LWI29_025441 [Acer saccharum]KAK0608652.1 hypothetical protein LWI29_033911 [Acer saccharum]KAK0608698.1 hypothetical protein LWI29_034606 [Acer saccharum]
MKKSSSQLLPTELESPGPVIFTVSSLEVTKESVDHVNVHGRLASFLENCHFCKKDISLTDVFMYGCMRGFCSIECRDKQMMIEKFDKPSKIFKGDINTGERKSSQLQPSNIFKGDINTGEKMHSQLLDKLEPDINTGKRKSSDQL